MENLPDDFFINMLAFTKTTYRDVYPTVDPTAPANSLAGKVAVVTGANRGIGRRVCLTFRLSILPSDH